MTSRQLERKYIELQEAIREIPGGVKCADDPSLFFPDELVGSYADRKDVSNQAKAICSQCPVRLRCFDYALSAHMVGIWGGTTTEERTRLRSS